MEPEPAQSSLQTEVLPKGSVLCLDIDGVCAPLGRTLRFQCDAPPPGFVVKPPRPDVPFHPAVPKWLAELERAFTHVVWISSWGINCAAFAEHVGADFATRWPFLAAPWLPKAWMPDPWVEKPGALPWDKLEPVRCWIASDQPVAVVDDHLAPRRISAIRDQVSSSVAQLRSRPGPLLLVAPHETVGLSRESVDLLCEFGRNPKAKRFDDREVRRMHHGWWTQWPWPVGGHENPVTLEVENEQEWGGERMMAQEVQLTPPNRWRYLPMTDSIKLADLPDDALSAIAVSPSALDDETLSAVAFEFERRAVDKRVRATYIRKYVDARQHGNVFSLVQGQQ